MHIYDEQEKVIKNFLIPSKVSKQTETCRFLIFVFTLHHSATHFTPATISRLITRPQTILIIKNCAGPRFSKVFFFVLRDSQLNILLRQNKTFENVRLCCGTFFKTIIGPNICRLISNGALMSMTSKRKRLRLFNTFEGE